MKVTWLGDGSGAEENEFRGVVFKKGEAVDVTDETMIAKAKTNKFFQVGGGKAQDEPSAATIPGPTTAGGEVVRNAAFGTEEELRAHREESEEAAERNDEIQADAEKRGPGRPRKSA